MGSLPLSHNRNSVGLCFISLLYKKQGKEFLVAQEVKGLALSLQPLRSLLWCRFSPWPGSFHMLSAWPKKKKKKKTEMEKDVQGRCRSQVDVLYFSA